MKKNKKGTQSEDRVPLLRRLGLIQSHNLLSGFDHDRDNRDSGLNAFKDITEFFAHSGTPFLEFCVPAGVSWILSSQHYFYYNPYTK